jgi:hypothetical protein
MLEVGSGVFCLFPGLLDIFNQLRGRNPLFVLTLYVDTLYSET